MTNKPEGRPGNGLTYRDAGVDIEAGNAFVDAIGPLARDTARPGADGTLGGFGGLFDLRAAGFDDPVLVAANDGVGTKLKIAIDAGSHETVGIDLVAMCVNDLVVQGAEPLFFLDYYASGKLELETARAVIGGIASGCRIAGCALIGGETAEMPGMYAGGDYDLAGFAVGAAERGALLPRGDLGPGDILIGLASSGPHSNGYSLIRRVMADQSSDLAAPAPFDPARSLADRLLEPTRIYVKPILAALGQSRAIKALAHVTGGGLAENLPRVLPDNLCAHVDLGRWRAPAIFGWLGKAGRIAQPELLRTFNCGIGMVVVSGADEADTVAALLREHGERAYEIGALEACGSGAPRLRFSGELEFAP